MGGCRCTFRDCKNSTSNMPGMHFFHFPFKDAERCKKWALYSRQTNFLCLPHSQLRNKTICGIHFADKYFMNYLKESLTRNAIPTLLEKSNGHMIEVHIDENELKKLVYPVPSKQQTIDLPEKSADKSMQSIDNEIDSISSVSYDDIDPLENDKPKVLNQIVNRKIKVDVDEEFAPIGLKLNTYGSIKRFATATELKTIPPKRILVKQYKSEQESLSSSIKIIGNNHQIVSIKNNADADRSKLDNTKTHLSLQNNQRSSTSQISQTVDVYPNIDEMDIHMNDSDDNTSHNKTNKIKSVAEAIKKDDATIDKAMYLQMMAEHTKQIEELKKMLAEKLQSEQCPRQQSTSVSASSSSDVRGETKIGKGPTMTKIQLFNGIRKYLNPSMVALLRMEIFGGADHEYRSDEKQIAKELFNLNASVYDYMREEWRFRLPSKAQVELWLKEPDDEDISEFF